MTWYAYIKRAELWRPVVEVKEVKRGKNKGQFKVRLGSGKWLAATRVIERKED